MSQSSRAGMNDGLTLSSPVVSNGYALTCPVLYCMV